MAEQWKLQGTYMEACNCEPACPCVFLSPPTEGECTALVAWHIDRGHFGNTRLDGLNVAVAIHSPGNMAESKWRAALYLDAKASEEQQRALGQIFSGQAGGHPARLAEHMGDVLGVKSVPFEYQGQGRSRAIRIGDVGQASIEAVTGENDAEITIHGHPLTIAPNEPVVVARSKKVEYRDHGYTWTISGRNGFYSPFTYQGA